MKFRHEYQRQIELGLIMAGILGFWFAFALAMKWWLLS